MKKSLLALAAFVVIFTSCKKEPKEDPYTINQKTVSINFDEEHQFSISKGPNAIDPAQVKFSSSNEVTGTIDSKGLFMAKRIGTTTIKAEVGGTTIVSEVTITPYSNIVIEPYPEYNGAKSTIKAKEKRVLETETATGLLYIGENPKVDRIYYAFENGAMEGAIVAFKTTKEIMEEAILFYRERYAFLGEDEDAVYFRDKTSVLAMSVDDNIGFNVIYVKNVSGQASVVNLADAKRLFSAGKQKTKLKALLK